MLPGLPGFAPGLSRCRASRRQPVQAAARDDDLTKYSSLDFDTKYGQAVGDLTKRTGAGAGKQGSKGAAISAGTGVFLILLVNLAVFVADHVLHLPIAQALYLNHRQPHWWQFITCAFCHHNWEHLSGNAFMLFVFGRVVEEEEGLLGVWLTYLVCALGGSLASWWALPKYAVSLGASGAVFGLFAVAVLCKLSWNPKKLLEAGILGQFVVKQVLQEVQAQAAGGTMLAGAQVGHIAHLAGALMGVLLVAALSRLPAAGAD